MGKERGLGHMLRSDLDKHLVAHSSSGRLSWGTVDGHGFSVSGEFQSELLLHQLADHLEKQGWEGPEWVKLPRGTITPPGKGWFLSWLLSF